jgi:hypothetical protein
MNLHNEISKVAFELYEKSGRVEGHDLDNWLEAEKIVMARYKEQEKLGPKIPTPKKIASTSKSVTSKLAPKAKKSKT